MSVRRGPDADRHLEAGNARGRVGVPEMAVPTRSEVAVSNTSLAGRAPSAGRAGGGTVGTGHASSASRMRISRLIGALFLLGFLSYGLGSGLANSVVGGSDFLPTVSAHKTTLILGAFLMLLNSVVDVAKGVLFFPILERHSKRTALAYLSAMIVEVVLLAVGALALLMIVPLAKHSADIGDLGAGWATSLGSVAVDTNTMAYQIGELALAIGCVFLCALLLRARLIPRPLALGGLIGYPLLAAGSIAEVFGLHIGLIFSIPGGLFELAFGFWLLIKGFEPEGYGQLHLTERASPGPTSSATG
jgi:hypothetical protein